MDWLTKIKHTTSNVHGGGDKRYKSSDTFYINPENNGGESVSIRVDYFDNGKRDSLYFNAYLQMNCYGTYHVDILLAAGKRVEKLKHLGELLSDCAFNKMFEKEQSEALSI